MDLDRLLDIVASLPALHSHAALVQHIARPCVDITLHAGPPESCRSRFGGLPLVPPDFVWPSHPEAEYRFLGQIDFSEIDSPPAPLPETGLLCLFYLQDAQGNLFWQDDGYVVGHYRHDPTLLIEKQPPHESHVPPCALALKRGWSLPERRELLEGVTLDEMASESLFYDVPEMARRPNQWLLGYPRYNTLAYDPTPGTDWVPLLVVPSIDALDWCWHDGDTLMIFIEADRLAARDFDHLKCDAG
jgi:uncharacterized protein YwqG